MSESAITLPPEPSGSQPTVPPPPSAPGIFRGPNGIRAGWRALIFLAIVAALVAVVNLGVWLVMHFLLHRPPRFGTVSSLSPTVAVLSDGPIFLFTGLAALIMSRIEHRKWGKYGLPVRSAFRKNFWFGTLVGFLAISTSLLAIFALHGFHLTGLAIHGRTILTATAAWTAAFVVVGLGEEFAFRGYLQFTLTTGMGFWPAAVLLSSLFGLAHAVNPGETKFGLLSVVCFGLLFSLFLAGAEIYSGQWDSMPVGTGVKLFSTALPTAAWLHITTYSTPALADRLGLRAAVWVRKRAFSHRSLCSPLGYCSAGFIGKTGTNRSASLNKRTLVDRKRSRPAGLDSAKARNPDGPLCPNLAF